MAESLKTVKRKKKKAYQSNGAGQSGLINPPTETKICGF